ncbi:MAG: hypothetical protein JXA93_20275 [Anaerolineae bacterium]|nr:hypothetical protein [Anaerolineae bacterium]
MSSLVQNYGYYIMPMSPLSTGIQPARRNRRRLLPRPGGRRSRLWLAGDPSLDPEIEAWLTGPSYQIML